MCVSQERELVAEAVRLLLTTQHDHHHDDRCPDWLTKVFKTKHDATDVLGRLILVPFILI